MSMNDLLIECQNKVAQLEVERDRLAAKLDCFTRIMKEIYEDLDDSEYDPIPSTLWDLHGTTPDQCLNDIRAKAIESIDPVNFVSIALRHTTVCGDFDYQDVKDAFKFIAAEHRQAANGGE